MWGGLFVESGGVSRTLLGNSFEDLRKKKLVDEISVKGYLREEVLCSQEVGDLLGYSCGRCEKGVCAVLLSCCYGTMMGQGRHCWKEWSPNLFRVTVK